MVDFLIATAIAAASVSAAYPPATPIADADPAIWVVNDADTVIYLFGTFHALDGKSVWFNDEVETAFERSDELVLETIVPDGPRSASAPPVENLGVAPSASFLASTRMAIKAGRARGMKTANGADMILRRAAEASGKPVEGLESFDYQLGMFGRMSQQPAQTVAPAQDLSSAGNLAIVMGQMQAAWNRGDSAIFATMLDQMRANSPASYDVMFTQRTAIGRAGSRSACKNRASCSSPSAPAISRAPTAFRPSSPSSASAPPALIDGPNKGPHQSTVLMGARAVTPGPDPGSTISSNLAFPVRFS